MMDIQTGQQSAFSRGLTRRTVEVETEAAVGISVNVAGFMFRHSVAVLNSASMSERAIAQAAMPALMDWLREMLLQGKFAGVANVLSDASPNADG